MKMDSHSSSIRKNFYAGFTLLEVLVASAILAIVVILLIVMADHTTKIWHNGERRRDTAREVRAGLELITEDLHNAVVTTNPETLFISSEQKSGTPDLKKNVGSRLFFLVSHPGEKRSLGNEGDLCAIGYFIEESPGDTATANLYRFHASGAVVAKAFEKNKLQELYSLAGATNTATTELLARHLAKLDVRRVENDPSGTLLMISLSTPRNERERKKNEPLRDDQLLRYSTIIRLPPEREQARTNGF